jgi:hypothetical protein
VKLSGRFWPNAQAHLAEWRPENLATLGNPDVRAREKESGEEPSQIRALSAHSAAEFNILPGRWQHLWLVAIVPPKRGGKWTEMTATQHGGTLRH